MTDEFIPLSAPDLRGRERQYLTECIDQNWVSSAGPFVTQLETRMAALSGRARGVAAVNGTAALHLTLIALGVGRDKLVVLPDWTFIATANAVMHAGATPYFVDVEERSWTMDAALLAKVLKQEAGKVAAVIVVHTLGHAADMDVLSRVCDAAEVPLIEDAAGAVGSTYKGKPLGGLSRAGCFSFNGNKLVTGGGGGMIVTDDQALADTAKHRSTQAREGTDYVHSAVGWNYRMTNLNAAVAVAQLERLDEMIATKREIAARYDASLGGTDLVPMPRLAWAGHNYWLYSVLAPSRDAAADLVAALRTKSVEARVFWRALSSQAPYKDAPRRLNGIAEKLSGRTVSLPSSSNLTATQQTRVIAAIKDWAARSRAQERAGAR
ncbi:MAG: aminotransferase class I/II-fold pyridoxal phosphate-dependent enzyme [Gammaproteobacteria bacterium]|nr:aminotransferase class I/II-fold pyridoxal phosphate-dependent enzyme [Gammaproteobacteria bacterium]